MCKLSQMGSYFGFAAAIDIILDGYSSLWPCIYKSYECENGLDNHPGYAWAEITGTSSDL